MAGIKLIALDLDGTLLNDKKELPAANEQALRECISRGIYIVPATGRTVYGIPEPVRTIPGVRYAITINGGKVIDMEENKIVSSCLLTREQTVRIMKAAEEFCAACKESGRDDTPLMYDAYVEGLGVSEGRFLDHMDDYGISPGIQELLRRTRKRYPNIIKQIESIDTPVEKVTLFFKKPSYRGEMREILNQQEGILVSSSMPNNLEINAAGATKGDGILRLAEYLGIKREETMAFGDGENDISMIEKAGLGVVMENGAPFLKKMADYVTSSNEKAGVAEAIRKFALNG